MIEEGHIKYKGEAYHPYHFNCSSCRLVGLFTSSNNFGLWLVDGCKISTKL